MDTELVLKDRGQANKLSAIAGEMRKAITQDVLQKIWGEIGTNMTTGEMANVNRILSEISRLQWNVQDGCMVVPSDYLPILKAAVNAQRLKIANIVEGQLQKVNDFEMARLLRHELEVFDPIVQSDWFKNTVAAKLPRLTDVLTIERAESILGSQNSALRQYDEKFHILQAPTMFTEDLDRLRAACGIRELSIVVGFIDIDDFKTFNRDFGDSVVDAFLLPQFMRLLEAQVFARGYAYRQGGDEYLVTLPNTGASEGASILEDFRAKLRKTQFEKISRTPTVSIGLCEVRHDSSLTNAEIRERAEKAKTEVKNASKNAIKIADPEF